jgi:hypothetical protein
MSSIIVRRSHGGERSIDRPSISTQVVPIAPRRVADHLLGEVIISW